MEHVRFTAHCYVERNVLFTIQSFVKKGVFLIIQSFVEKSHNYHARLCKKYFIYRTQQSTNALLTESQALCFHES